MPGPTPSTSWSGLPERNRIPSGEVTAWFRVTAIAAWAGVLLYLAAAALGSVLVPGYSHVSDSMFALAGAPAPRGLVVTLALFDQDLAVGLLGIALLKTSHRSPAATSAAALQVLMALTGILVVTVFPPDGRIDGTSAQHAVAALVMVLAAAGAVFLWAAAWRTDARWHSMSSWSVLAGIGILTAGAAWAVGALAEVAYLGLLERLTQLVILAWFVVVGAFAVRRLSLRR